MYRLRISLRFCVEISVVFLSAVAATLHQVEIKYRTDDVAGPTSTWRCAETLDVALHLDGELVSLHLTRNDHMSAQGYIPVTLLHHANNTFHRPVLNESHTQQSPCFYQDIDKLTAMSCVQEHKQLQWRGLFHSLRGVFALKPASMTQRRLRRHSTSSGSSRSLHLATMVRGPLISEMVNNPDSPIRSRRSGTRYEIGIMAVADYSLYKKWYDRSDATTSSDKVADAVYNIKYHLSHIINEVDMRYRGIVSSTFDLSVKLVKIVIAQDATTSSWTESIKLTQPSARPIVDAEAALDLFKDWYNQDNVALGSFDHAMLFTGLNLFGNVNGERDLGRIGNAVVGGTCRYDRASIVEDQGPFGSATAAAHELGHSLGALHDGDNGCHSDDNFIMAPSIEIQSDEDNQNIFVFSSCSINEFSNFLRQLDRANRVNCLLDSEDVFDPTAWRTFMAILPGQQYPIDEQCRQVYNDESYYCGSQRNANNACNTLLCYSTEEASCFRLGSVSAARGTTCGNHKWCANGECVYDSDAPAADENCLFGDYVGSFGLGSSSGARTTCTELAQTQPWLCYIEQNLSLCCRSCGDLYDESTPECAYGDRAAWCATLDAKGCYNQQNEEVCCNTCTRHRAGRTGECRYGDKASWCNTLEPHNCYSQNNEDNCCDSCPAFDTRIPECQYGDRFSNCGSEHCGQEANRIGCCETCYTGTLIPTTSTTTSATTSTTIESLTTSSPTSASPTTRQLEDSPIDPSSISVASTTVASTLTTVLASITIVSTLASVVTSIVPVSSTVSKAPPSTVSSTSTLPKISTSFQLQTSVATTGGETEDSEIQRKSISTQSTISDSSAIAGLNLPTFVLIVTTVIASFIYVL